MSSSAASSPRFANSGILVVASGNVVHNLREIRWNQPDAAFDWAERFDDAAAEQLASSPGDILRLADHADYDAAVPTPDHFIPLLYIAGMAAEQGEPLDATGARLCDGVDLDDLLRPRRRRAWLHRRGRGAATLPAGVPADQTNI